MLLAQWSWSITHTQQISLNHFLHGQSTMHVLRHRLLQNCIKMTLLLIFTRCLLPEWFSLTTLASSSVFHLPPPPRIAVSMETDGESNIVTKWRCLLLVESRQVCSHQVSGMKRRTLFSANFSMVKRHNIAGLLTTSVVTSHPKTSWKLQTSFSVMVILILGTQVVFWPMSVSKQLRYTSKTPPIILILESLILRIQILWLQLANLKLNGLLSLLISTKAQTFMIKLLKNTDHPHSCNDLVLLVINLNFKI